MRLSLGFLCLLPAAAAGLPVFRLPGNVKPAHYDLEITIIPRQAAFRGVVRIDADVLEPAHSLWLNSRGLDIDDARAVVEGRAIPARTTVSGEFLGLHWTTPLRAGRVRLEISYRGEIGDRRNVGIYRKKAGDDWYVFTAFTPIEARGAFPCFDEPAYKAPWRIVLHVPQSDVAVSNARMLSERPGPDGMKRVEFAQTRPLPSEVVAFAVGPFDVVPDGVAGRHRVPVRILTPRGRGAEAEGARAATAPILSRLEEYTGIPYPWDKLDHLAVIDMPFGAVENPGLITYRDSILLARPAAERPAHRFRMRGTMAHELAHQWFGNLVTQAWWDDVWLSEGFATWLGSKISDLELPDFERGMESVRGRAEIMRADTSAQTRPVRLAMNSREDMARVYGRIVYVKGASILRMVEHWLGPEPFQQGIREYLRRHANGTATTANLVSALRASTGVDVAPVLESHLNHTGYPVIRFDCGGGKASIAGTGPWTTPVCPKGEGGAPACLLVSGDAAPANLDGGCPAWWWPNRDGAGYFAAGVSPEYMGAIVTRGWSQMTAPERLSFVEDLRATVAARQIDGDAVRTVLPALTRDDDPNVAGAAYRLLLSMIAAAPPEERGKFDDTVNEVLGSGRRR